MGAVGIIISIVHLLCLHYCSTTTIKDKCDVGWFGPPQCQYKCRCSDDRCDANGSCIYQSKCKSGWFGPECQYYNIARRHNVITKHASAITDDDENTCSKWDGLKELTITWSPAIPFTWLRFGVNTSALLKNVSLLLKNSDTVTCGNVTKSVINEKTLDIHCSEPVMVRRVTLTGNGVTRMCYLYISGGRNVALGQRSSQSSNYTGLPFNEIQSGNAVDGNTSGNFDHNSCTHTNNEVNPTWHLNLTSTKQISRYILYNRDAIKYRLKGFLLQSFHDKTRPVFEHQDTTKNPQNDYVIIDTNASRLVKEIEISLNREDILTLCEVEAYGDSVCPRDRYGRDCERFCKCDVQSEACFVSTGNCPSGCATGFKGEGCGEECERTKFGKNCQEQCSQDCLNAACHHMTGLCNACPPGKLGDHCDKNCSFGNFGTKCNETCSANCAGNQGCNNVDGACIEGCKSGYTSALCNKSCENGTYGQDCKYNCSQFCVVDTNIEQSVCHHESGTCYSGCANEYEGPLCLQYSGLSSGIVAGPIIAVLLLAMLAIAAVFVWRRWKQPKCSSSLDNALQLSSGVTDGPTNQVDKPHSNKCDLTPATANINVIYCNTILEPSKTTIAVDDLNKFMLSHTYEHFAEQFKTIPPPTNTSMSVGLSTENKSKNRYKNICTYDHSRVQLIANRERGHGDYINASYVQGYNNKKKFIASQGPSKVILEDFIRMLWEQKSDVVVMLTNLVEDGHHKCEKYWPDDDELVLGEIKIKIMNTQTFSDCIIRKMQLSKANQNPHTLTQFHYVSWPDKDVPDNPWSLVDFQSRVASFATKRPVVVHCSAGVGRTGTFIALCNVIEQAKVTHFLDFYSTVSKLRQDRVSMIQTVKQYLFLHKAAQLAMVCLGTTVTTSDGEQRLQALEETSVNGQTNMEIEFKALCDVCTADSEDGDEEGSDGSVCSLYQNSRDVSNRMKNRFINILPKENYRPHLFCETKEMGDYINAVFLPSLTNQNSQILTQLPLPTTIFDFWRLVTQFNVSLILAFEVDTNDATVGAYLPPESNPVMHCGSFEIKTKSRSLNVLLEETVLSITKQTRKRSALSLTSHTQTEGCQVTHLKCTKCDLNPQELLALAQQLRSHSTKDKSKVLYMCRNGADFSGLLYVVSALLDRMDNDHQLMVPLVVGAAKNVRPQVIPTLDQYRMLYQMLGLYCESPNTYGNCGDQVLKMTTNAGVQNCGFVDNENDDLNIYANS